MRVSAIQQNFYKDFSPKKQQVRNNENASMNNPEIPIPQYNISFGLANAWKLKILFSHGLPCMYRGIEMIDPKKIQRFLKAKSFEAPAVDVIKLIEPYEDSISETEKRVYTIIKEHAIEKPTKTIKEILQTIAPTYQKRLRKKQAPIFEELIEVSKELPDGYRYRFKQFMNETNDKLQDKPVIVPFSSNEFKYKLEKIKNDVKEYTNPKAVKVVNKLLKEAERFSVRTNPKTIENQKRIISFMEIILKRSVLAENEQLKNLMESSKSKLNYEKIKVPFSKKIFTYDLAKLIEDLPDKDLRDRMLEIATKLPTSRESCSAFITKYASENSEKTMYRILCPFFASVEHILPKSCGGADEMHNYGGACARENSDRKSLDFTHQLKKRPQARQNCQKYVNRLIEYVKKGIFKNENIDIKYIEKFKTTIQKQSKGSLVLDTSKLYE